MITISPNAYGKGTCDDQWTRLTWPCQGTTETCQCVVVSKAGDVGDGGIPLPECCWRYSFRYQLEQAKRSNGFMLQIVEYAFNEEGRMPNFDILNDKAEEGLGDGQKIELEIANSVGVKVFRVWEPLSEYGKWHFEESHVEKLISEQIRHNYYAG